MKKIVMVPVIIVLCLCIAFIVYMFIGTMPKDTGNKNVESVESVESTKTVESESATEESASSESSGTGSVSTKALMGYKIELKGEENMTVALNSEFVDPGATATDADGNDVSDKVRTFGNVKTSEAGIYRIYYFAGGAIAVRTVTVS